VTVAPAGQAAATALADEGLAMHELIGRLYPICRSITGDGVRQTLAILAGEGLPLEQIEVPTGTPAYDWEVPREWTIRDAYVADSAGRRVIDFRRSNLSVVGHSAPVDARMTLAELRPHLHTAPEAPDAIPYRTSYFRESWGFCLPHAELAQLAEGEYDVRIDSALEPGHLTYGEVFLPGELDDEVLVSAHVCHPSLANDNLSGIAVATFLAKELAGRATRRLSYRFVFAPGLIGAIVWLSRNEETAARIAHGLVLACAGDAGPVTYKRSRQGDAKIDRAVAHVLEHSGRPYELRDFSPFGYDERQYNSPGFALPVGVFMRTPYGEYAEYHTSKDDLTVVRPEALADSLATLTATVDVLEGDGRYRNLHPRCEPQLGKRGLYRQLGGGKPGGELELALLWVLNLSDGNHSLLDVAGRASLPFAVVRQAADALEGVGLLAAAAGRG
jgi:aminopeptidase-like protein